MEITLTYPVVGVKFENRQNLLEKFYEKYEYGSHNSAKLLKEENNQYDANAVAVFIEINGNFEKIGYISKNDNSLLRENFEKIVDTSVSSIGRNRVGDLGISISVKFNEGENNG